MSRLPPERIDLTPAIWGVGPHEWLSPYHGPGLSPPNQASLGEADWPTPQGPLNITAALTHLVADLCARLPAFAHINPPRLLVSSARSRGHKRHGLQARLTPLLLAGNCRDVMHAGRRYRIQRITLGSVDQDNLMTVFLPRFLDQTPLEKLITLCHELYHIAPDGQGGIRQFPGTTDSHGGSQAKYDQRMSNLAHQYLAQNPPAKTWRFLEANMATLLARYGFLVGLTLPRPKLILADLLP
jgi:hypothetical protein